MPHLSPPRSPSLSLFILNFIFHSYPQFPDQLSASPGDGELWSCLWRCLLPLGSSPSDNFMEAEEYSEWPFLPHLLLGRELFITFQWHPENIGFGGVEPRFPLSQQSQAFLSLLRNLCYYSRSWSLCLIVKQNLSPHNKHIFSVCWGEERWQWVCRMIGKALQTWESISEHTNMAWVIAGL